MSLEYLAVNCQLTNLQLSDRLCVLCIYSVIRQYNSHHIIPRVRLYHPSSEVILMLRVHSHSLVGMPSCVVQVLFAVINEVKEGHKWFIYSN